MHGWTFRIVLTLLPLAVVIHGVPVTLAGATNPPTVFAARDMMAENGLSSPAPYMARLRQRVEVWRAELPAIRASAEAAAARVIGGGRLFAAGPQRSFAPEALGRSGGLMLIRAYDPATALGTNDTILAATADAQPDPSLAALLARARAAGSTVVLFGAVDREALPLPGPGVQVLPAAASRDGRPVSIESVGNVVGLWTWVAEFVGACVERGRMPCMYQSYGRPGGRERSEKLRGIAFHERTDVTPATAAGLGARYLNGLASALRNMEEHDRAGFQRGASLIRDSHAAGHAVRVVHTAHMFPAEMTVAQAPAWIVDARPSDKPAAGDVAIVLDYQTFNRERTDAIARNGSACILTCSETPPASFTADPRHVYLNPYWEVDDALLDLPGYDIKILPISGIMQSAIYWQLVELATGT
jgi:hypothetical protein